ncbi:hypothetical protein GZH49_00535 [Nocardia terpenica]|uniref:hypothetical protein n=1 Tax=Nocardia terpenica TaxID=455432 RepID=UPI002FE35A82
MERLGMELRLLGSGSGHGTCPAAYAADSGELVIQGDITGRNAVAVPHRLLNWLEPGMRLTVEASEQPDKILVPGELVTDPKILQQLKLADHETAVVVH